MVKAVVFDINGVIWKSRKFNTARLALLSSVLKLHPKTIKSKLNKVITKFQLNQLDLGTWLTHEFKLSPSQLEDFNYQLQSLFETHYQTSFYPQSLSLIRRLQQQGIAVGCLSNMPNFMAELFNKAGLFCHFDFKILSSIVGFKKPNQKIFKKIFTIGNWKPQEVLIIDNEINNINVAKHLGFSTHHFKSWFSLVSYFDNILS